jgi:hypothetical protein
MELNGEHHTLAHYPARGLQRSLARGLSGLQRRYGQSWRRAKLETSIITNENVIALNFKWRMWCLAIGDE